MQASSAMRTFMGGNRSARAFLRRCSDTSSGCSIAVATGARPESAPAATDDEELTRFLTQSNHYTSSDMRVSGRAFSLPRNETTLSIYRTDGLSATDRWQLGDQEIGANPTRRILGAALFTPSVVVRAGLRLDRDGTDHPRHASLCDWPSSKDEQKKCATILAAAAALALRTG
jgi:hypothetical protein